MIKFSILSIYIHIISWNERFNVILHFMFIFHWNLMHRITHTVLYIYIEYENSVSHTHIACWKFLKMWVHMKNINQFHGLITEFEIIKKYQRILNWYYWMMVFFNIRCFEHFQSILVIEWFIIMFAFFLDELLEILENNIHRAIR